MALYLFQVSSYTEPVSTSKEGLWSQPERDGGENPSPKGHLQATLQQVTRLVSYRQSVEFHTEIHLVYVECRLRGPGDVHSLRKLSLC